MTAPDFREAIARAGLTPPDVIEPGAFHRFPGAGKANGNTAGWCKQFPDGRGGIFGDFASGFVESWQAKQTRPLSLAEREAFRRNVAEAKAKAEAERAREHADAARRAAERWQAATPANPAHPYLARKGIEPQGIRHEGERLVIPARDAAGALRSLQFIDANGGKRFLTGGRVAGCYFAIGKPNGTLCIAEGYATGASIHEASGDAVAVAFNAGNLEPAALALRAKYPELAIIVCADDDYRTAGNPGIREATKAALAVGGLLAVPDFGDNRPDGATDFNDLHQHAGAEAVARCVANARVPDVPEAHPDAPGAVAAELASVELQRGDAIEMQPIRWLWPDYLAAGKLHVLAGVAGVGKTTLALAMAATVTIGGRWPDGTRCEAGDVMIWSGEDNPDDTLLPRLHVAGADMARIHFARRTREATGAVRAFDPATDFPLLSIEAARLPRLRLLLLDPVVTVVGGADSHKNSEVRRALQPLADFAARHRCAVLGISHFSKGTAGRDPLERVTGSLAFGAAARMVLAAATLPEDGGGGRVLVRAKSNIGPDGGGFRFDVDRIPVAGKPGIVGQRVLWGEAVQGPAREILGNDDAEDEPSGTGAKDFLRKLLQGGPVLAGDVFKSGEAHGYSKRQMQRARSAIGANVDKLGMRGGWQWSLPKMPGTPEDTEDAGLSRPDSSAPSAPSDADTAEVF